MPSNFPSENGNLTETVAEIGKNHIAPGQGVQGTNEGSGGLAPGLVVIQPGIGNGLG